MPRYLFKPMGKDEAREISGWRYRPPYDFYDAASDPDDLEELLDPGRRKGAYFSAFDEGEISSAFSSSRRRGRS